jgi:hypothetical protein
MKEVLTLEFQQLAEREKKIPYYCGETSVCPCPGTEPLSDSEDDSEDEVDDDAAMTSDISDDESATGKNDKDMSSSESSESEEEVVSPVAKPQVFNISDPPARRSPFPPRREQPKYSRPAVKLPMPEPGHSATFANSAPTIFDPDTSLWGGPC